MSENGDVASRSPSRHGSPDREGSVKSDRSHKKSKSRSRSNSRSRSRSHSRSHSRRHKRRRSYTRSRSRSRSYSRSPKRSRRTKSRSRDRRRRTRSRSHSPMSSRRRHFGNRDDPEPTKCLGIFGLSLYTQERDLREVFGRYGTLEECNIVYDRQSGRSRGFAFIYFRSIDDSIEAKDRCTGIEIDGRRIRVDYSITKRAHTPTPGIYLGKPSDREDGGRPSRGGGRGGYDRGGYDRGGYDRGDRGYDRGGGYDRGYGGRSRRSPSPYNRRSKYSYSRSRSRSYSPRRSYY